MARLSSSTSEPPPAQSRLFDQVYYSAPVLDATSDAAWVQAMLDVEAAIATANAAIGLIPVDSATAIARACRVEGFDIAAISVAAGQDATPVIELVRQLRAQLPSDLHSQVHLGATSQDIVDSAAMLVARRALSGALLDGGSVAERLAELAGDHRDTRQVGRSMLQHGQLTTFGAWCAGRLVAVGDASQDLRLIVERRLPLQLGGAVGTLTEAGDRAGDLLRATAQELELDEPVVPWHTSRGGIARLAAAIGVFVGEMASIAQDVVLLSSTEIGEVRLTATGGSSAMPHKRNPASAVIVLAGAHRVPGLVATLLAGMPQELQRSAGRWQAEWGTLTELLRLAGGVAAHTADTLAALRVDADRMSAHAASLVQHGIDDDPGAAGLFVDRALRHHRDLHRP